MHALPLASLCWPSTSVNRYPRALLLAAAGVLLLTVSAKFKVPFYPVPMTMQSFVVLAIGMGYGMRLGVATVLAYLAIGALGAPVFAAGGGIAYFFGPTGGFLLGFLVAAAVAAAAAQRSADNRLWSAILALFIADALVFICGGVWLAAALGWDWQKAIAAGVTPFIIGDISKVILAATVIVGGKKLLNRNAA